MVATLYCIKSDIGVWARIVIYVIKHFLYLVGFNLGNLEKVEKVTTVFIVKYDREKLTGNKIKLKSVKQAFTNYVHGYNCSFVQKKFKSANAGFKLAVCNLQIVKRFGSLRMSFCIFSKNCKSLKLDTSWIFRLIHWSSYTVKIQDTY